MKTSDFIAKKLSSYTNFAFTGQGGSVVHILDSLSKIKKVKVIPAQNEQGASLASDAYTRITGKIGVVITTSGPGTLNAFQGLACSYYDSIPGLYISGAPVLSALKKNFKLRQLGFQEMDIRNIVKSFTKYAVRITNLNQVNYEIEKCVHLAFDGRPGPCLIDLPDDIQRMNILSKHHKKFHPPKKIYNLSKTSLKKFKTLVEKSKKPLLILGNGIKLSKSEKETQKFINKSKIPYAATWSLAENFNLESKLNVGSFGVYATRHGNFAVQNSDLLIILGSRLNGTLIGSDPKKFAPNAIKIQVDIDEAELKGEHRVRIDHKFKINLKEFLNKINRIQLKINNLYPWYSQINAWKHKYPIISDSYYKEKSFVNPYVFFKSLSDVTKTNNIIIPDASANLVWTYQAFKPKIGQRIFTALNHSPMGYSVAAAIGASLPNKKKNIIAIIGDGSMQMNIQEIENIKYYNLPIKIFIINNSGYGMVKQTIDTWLNKNYVGCDQKSGLSIPNFKKVFNSYGIKSTEIKKMNNLQKQIKKVLNFRGPILCDVRVDPNARIIPKVKPGNPIDSMLPKLK